MHACRVATTRREEKRPAHARIPHPLRRAGRGLLLRATLANLLVLLSSKERLGLLACALVKRSVACRRWQSGLWLGTHARHTCHAPDR